MRKKKYENFIAKLMMTKDIIDAAELEKHIRNVVGDLREDMDFA